MSQGLAELPGHGLRGNEVPFRVLRGLWLVARAEERIPDASPAGEASSASAPTNPLQPSSSPLPCRLVGPAAAEGRAASDPLRMPPVTRLSFWDGCHLTLLWVPRDGIGWGGGL